MDVLVALEGVQPYHSKQIKLGPVLACSSVLVIQVYIRSGQARTICFSNHHLEKTGNSISP